MTTLAELRSKARGSVLAAQYRMTIEMYEALLVYQQGRCAACGRARSPDERALSVDHDHSCCPYEPGKRSLRSCGKCVRGLLCSACNLADALAGAPHVDWPSVMEHARTVPPVELLTLRDAVAAGLVPWSYDAAKQRLFRRVGKVPQPGGRRGNAIVYSRADLVAWVEASP